MKVHLVRPAWKQVYMHGFLKQDVHYSILRNQEDALIKACEQLKIPVQIYQSNRSYISGDYLCVINSGTKQFKDIAVLFDNLQLIESCKQLHEKSNQDKDAWNNHQNSWGFSGQNRKRCPARGQYSGKPQKHTNLTDQQASRMATMSNIARKLNFPFVKELNKAESQKQLNEFACRIDPVCLFEGASDIAYQSVYNLCTTHTDTHNCSLPGFKEQMVVSQIHKSWKGKFRKSCLATYGWVACTQYMFGDNSSQMVANKINNFVRKQPNGLDSISPSTFLIKGEPIGDGSVMEKLRANIDKDAHTSFNLEVAIRVTRVNNNYYRFLELALCCGLVSSTDTFWT